MSSFLVAQAVLYWRVEKRPVKPNHLLVAGFLRGGTVRLASLDADCDTLAALSGVNSGGSS